jgi:superfamily II DNA or RNA helicase
MSNKENVNIVLHDNLNIRIDTTDYEYLNKVKEHYTEYVDGYMFTSKYKSGQWNGKKSLFNPNVRRLSYGLLLDLVKFTKKEFPHLEINIENDVKKMFEGIKPDPTWNLKHYPRAYQEDCILAALSYSKGCIVSCTASGKSLIIAYIIKELLKEEINNAIIIVPTIGLTTQFYNDLLDYGIYPELLGCVNSKLKEFDKRIVISTWQSLKNKKEMVGTFDCVIVDEVHSCAAKILHEVLQHATKARWRLGFTGTMPKCRLDELMVKSYIGPVLKNVTSKDLADDGFISHCNINMLHVNYLDKIKGDYNQVREKIGESKYRLGLIKHLCGITDHTILLLVDKIKEGEDLEEALRDKFPNRQVVFISGRDKAELREKWRLLGDLRDDVIIIATYQVFSVGINMPSLRSLVFASPSKSYIRVIQSIGRTLRLHEDKEGVGAIIWDIVDNTKFLKKHGEIRHRHYTFEKHTINEYKLLESNANFEMELCQEN